MGFQVFETQIFSGGMTREFEPVVGFITDVPVDGANDLVLLAYDRVLLYPQMTQSFVIQAQAGATGRPGSSADALNFGATFPLTETGMPATIIGVRDRSIQARMTRKADQTWRIKH